ncbi:hypothetical protein GW17_00037273 [Ensete ventricosum]|nr:hypothetical protein GW17_00037273 [Ensete ventricosum]
MLLKPAIMNMQAKIVGKACISDASSEYEDCVPMVDKVVDVGWKNQISSSVCSSSRGYLLVTGRFQLFDICEPSEGIRAQIITWLTAFIMALYAMLCSVTSCVTRRLPDNMLKSDHCFPEFDLNPMPEEEFRPPSPSPTFKEVDILSSVLKKLGELEEKVDKLQAKPSTMPHEKEELLDAAVRRVDALEAELIATKRVSFYILDNYAL